MAEFLVPAEVFPPGEFLRDELEARDWTQTEFADILGRPVRLVNEIIAGKRGITPQTAKEIAAALGTSPEFWLNLEAAYQLSRTTDVPDRIAKAAQIRAQFPVREMIKRGWIEDSENVRVLEAQVKRFYRINDLNERPRLAHAAKKSAEISNYGDLSPAQEAWLYRVNQIAAAMQVPRYSEEALRNALPRLHALMSEPEEVRHVPAMLEECGVRFVVVEPFPGSKIDGVCFWLDASPWSPVIGLTLRLDRIDNFWFVLRHEIEHVLRKDASLDNDLDPSADPTATGLPEQERFANEAAADFCVPTQRMEGFIARTHPLYSEQRVIGFARTVGVHPGIIVGQIQKRTGRWDLLRKHLAKIRDIIVQSAMTDGYGRVGPVGI